MSLSADKKIQICDLARKVVVDCYELTHELEGEKTRLTVYIRDAAVTAYISIAQGIFLKKKKKRKKFIAAALNAMVVIDAAIEVLHETKLSTEEKTLQIRQNASTCFQLLQAMQKKK